MQARKFRTPARLPGIKKYEVLVDIADSGLALAAARALNQMVGQAKSLFESGAQPEEVFREFDVERLRAYRSLDKSLAGELLGLYKDRKGDEKFSASVLVATAIFFISVAEPPFARDIIADLARRARKDESFRYIAKITLISVAELARGVSEEAGFADGGPDSLGKSCMGIFTKM